MKSFLVAAGLVALASTASATNVGVSINIGDPNFYGQIDIGGMPPPQVVYTQPVIVQRPVHYVETAPLYLHVPPGHEKHWEKHCAAYGACGRPVYFVKDNWYRQQYVPVYREQHVRGGEYRQEWHGEHERHEDRDDRHEDHGHGHGHDRDD